MAAGIGSPLKSCNTVPAGVPQQMLRGAADALRGGLPAAERRRPV